AGQRMATPTQEPAGEEDGGARLSIRARLKREREARKVIQRQLDDYLARLDAAEQRALAEEEAASTSAATTTTTSAAAANTAAGTGTAAASAAAAAASDEASGTISDSSSSIGSSSSGSATAAAAAAANVLVFSQTVSAEAASGKAGGSGTGTGTGASTSAAVGTGFSYVDWTRLFMQQAMRNVEPMWKMLHPNDTPGKGRHGGGSVGSSAGGEATAAEGAMDEEPMTAVAQLLGPAAAKAYYRGLRGQGYTGGVAGAALPAQHASAGATAAATAAVGRAGEAAPTQSPPPHASAAAGPVMPARSSEQGPGPDSPPRAQRGTKFAFSVDGPETVQERKLRDVAMRASRITRERSIRTRQTTYDAEELDEVYGTTVATLTHGSPVGELSTVTLHSAMRQESAVAGPRGCDLLLVDWEAYQQGVLAARAALLARSAAFLSSLPRERLSQLAELCLCLSVEAGTLLARQAAPLEALVVVQNGELHLLHETTSAASHVRTATLSAHAFSRTRNGRTHTLPLLATLSQTMLPSAAQTPLHNTPHTSVRHMHMQQQQRARTPGTPPLLPVSPPAGPPPPPVGGLGGSGNGALVEVSLQGLPLGELSTGGIVGESILGMRSGPQAGGAAAATAGGSNQAGHGNGHGQDSSAMLPGRTSVGGAVHEVHAGPVAPPPPADGPKWPATVLTSRPSVLLVIPKSVLYMAEFDFLRGELMRYAADRKVWLDKRVEAAYREAAAPTAPHVTFSPAPPPQQPTTPQSAASARRAVASPSGGGSATGNTTTSGAAAASSATAAPPAATSSSAAQHSDGTSATTGSDAAASASTSGGSGRARQTSSAGGPASDPSQQASSGTGSSTTGSASTTPTTTITRTNSGGGQRQVASKWDFLDAPTSASISGAAPPSPMSTSGAAAGYEAHHASATMPGCPGMSPPMGLGRTHLVVPPLPLAGLGARPGKVRPLSAQPRPGPVRVPSFSYLHSARDYTPTYSGAVGAGGAAAGMFLDGAGPSPVYRPILEDEYDDDSPRYDMPACAAAASEGPTPRRGCTPPGGSPLLPALAIPSSPFSPSRMVTPTHRVTVTGSGGVAEFEGLRTAGSLPPPLLSLPLPSPNGGSTLRASIHGGGGSGGGGGGVLTPPGGRRSLSGSSTTPGLPPPVSSSVLDCAYRPSSPCLAPLITTSGSSFSGPTGPPNSSRGKRASYSGFGGPGGYSGDRRFTISGGDVLNSMGPMRRSDVGSLPPSSPRPVMVPTATATVIMATAAAACTSPVPLGSSVPGLGVLDMLDGSCAPPSPVGVPGCGAGGGGYYSRTPRVSASGAVTPRLAGVDSTRQPILTVSDGARRAAAVMGARVSTAGGVAAEAAAAAAAAAEAEEEAALARSLVPRNQAGTFMVREGAASTPARVAATRRIANCF
ncbi:hypothetical protein Agub_g15695, partial [Astrephomene gubernaculifera]